MRDDQIPDLTRGNCVTVGDGDALEHTGGAEPHPEKMRACFVCNRDFEPKRAWQKFCSRRCRTRGWRERKASSITNYYGA